VGKTLFIPLPTQNSEEPFSGFKPEKLFRCITKKEGVKDKDLFSIMEYDRKSYSNG